MMVEAKANKTGGMREDAFFGVCLISISFIVAAWFCFNLADYFSLITIVAYYLVYSFVSLLLLLGLKRPFLLHPAFLFWGAYTLLVGIGMPIYLYSSSALGYSDSLLGVTLGGLLCFTAGCLLPIEPSEKPKRTGESRFALFDYKKLLLLAALAGVAVGLIYILKNFDSLFNSGNYNSSRIEAQSGQGVLLYLNGSLVVTCPLLYRLYLNGHLSKWTFIFFLLAAVGIFLLRGSRTSVMMTVVLVVLEHRRSRAIKKSTYIFFGILAIIFLGAFAVLRASSGNLFSSIRSLFTVVPLNTEYMFKYFPKRIGYLYGGSYLFNLNILLPGEGQDFTLWLKDQMGLTFSGGGITPGILGEFYLNFGQAGIYLGMFLLGFCTKWIRSAIQASSKWTEFAVYLAMQVALSVYGGLSNILLPVLTNLLLYSVLVVGCGVSFERYTTEAGIKESWMSGESAPHVRLGRAGSFYRLDDLG